MITEDVIDAIADALFGQYEVINNLYVGEDRSRAFIQLRDDTVVIANVIYEKAPFQDMNGFYQRAGYVGAAPLYRR